jgi:hypothetical protein
MMHVEDAEERISTSMKATERTLHEIINSPDHYLIPFFQRYYSWEEKHWERLWEDLRLLVEAMSEPREKRPRTHFLGVIVCTSEEPVPGKLPTYQVIDGQQRLLTLSILLCAIRDAAKSHNLGKMAEEIIETLLIHKFESEQEHYRIYPRLRDRPVYKALIDGKKIPHDPASGESQMIKAFTYFQEQIERDFPSSELLTTLFRVMKTQLNFVLITITKETPENPYLIFRSLNSTGLDLTQWDLVRNYVFMQVPEQRQDAFDREEWTPLEQRFARKAEQATKKQQRRKKIAGELLTGFCRDVLMSKGDYIQEGEVFDTFEQIYSGNGKPFHPSRFVSELEVQASVYDVIDGTTLHPNQEVQRAFQMIREFDIKASYPLILALLEKQREQLLSDEELAQALVAIVSFVIRRAICRESTRSHGPMLCEACKQLENRPLANLITYLSRYSPDDSRFIPELRTAKLYGTPYGKDILCWIERTLQRKSEPVQLDRCDIERILPGNLTVTWQQALGSEAKEIHTHYVTTLGNLTLLGNNENRKIKDKSFLEKKPVYLASKLSLNEYFHDPGLTQWGAKEIEDRAETLAKVAAHIWRHLPDLGQPRTLFEEV